MKKLGATFVVLAFGFGVVGCGSTEQGARTKNAAVTTTTTAAPKPDVQLTSTVGLIGYPLKLTATSASTPDAAFAFSTTSTNCRVDTYLNFLYFDSSVQGTCSVAVTKLAAPPVLAVATTTTSVASKPAVDVTSTVTFYPQSVPSTLQTGLVGYWPFNSASTLGWDAVTNTVDLKLVGKPTFRQVGKFGGGVSLDGVGDYLAGNGSGDSIAGLPVNNSAYTMSLWIQPKKFDVGRGLMGWGSFGADGNMKTNAFRMKGDFENVLGYIPGGLVNYWWGKDVTWDGYTFTKSYVMSDGRTACCNSAFTVPNWVHVAVTYDGKVRRIYYAGREVASDTPGSANQVANKNFRIGATSTALKEFFGGTIDDAAVWSRALTVDEVKNLSQGSLGQNNASLPASFKPFTPQPCYEVGGFCEVGDQAPDGGTVFYVGDFVDQMTNQRMKYLEFAPGDMLSVVAGLGNASLTGYQSLCGGSVHPIPDADKSGIGWGRRNTVLASNFCKSGAADDVLAYSSGGLSDWFIPSERELNELCKYARGQRVGDTAVNCSNTGALAAGWSKDAGHAYFLSSTLGATVNATLELLGSVLGPMNELLSIAVVIAQKTRALDNISWGDMQQGRVSYNFLTAEKFTKGDDSPYQVRPIRAFGPGFQAPLMLTASNGKVDAPVALSTSGGSGAGSVTYVVTDPGSAQCKASTDRTVVTPAAVGVCKVVAVKAASDAYFRAVSTEVIVNVAKGDQKPLVVAATSGLVGVGLPLSVTGGSGTGSVTYVITNAGSAKCAFVSGSTTQIVASAQGSCTITATKVGDNDYVDLPALTFSVTFAKQTQQSVSIAPASGSVDAEIALSVAGGSGTGAVSVAIADAGTTGCSVVSGKNAIVAGAEGTCSVTATKAGDATYGEARSTAVAVTVTNFACDESGKRADGTACQIGDTGPGGGRVFYISPTPIDYADGVSAGGTLLEVAPAGWNGSPNELYTDWCRTNVGLASGSDVGFGAENTSRLVKFGSCSATSAVSVVANATVKGKNDWFLPSTKELNEVCKFMRRQAVGDPSVMCTSSGSLRAPFIGGRDYRADYWTSTEEGSQYGQQNVTINMDTAAVTRSMEGGTYLYARPIRAFGPVKPPTTTSTSSTTTTTMMSQQCDNRGKRPDGTGCQVGDIGPAGGTIVLVSQTAVDAVPGVSGGGRFIEAAPADWTPYGASKSAVPLGCNDRTVGATDTAVGSGAANTAKLQVCKDTTNMAAFVLGISISNGTAVFDDWFIPSRDEAIPMASLKSKLTKIRNSDNLWSSSEIDEPGAALTSAWIIRAFDGSTAKGQKWNYSALLRPVRAFG